MSVADSLPAVSSTSGFLTQLKVFALTHQRAEQDAPALRIAFPEIRFVLGSPEDWKESVAEADAVFLGRGIPVDEVLAQAPRLRWIHNGGTGVDRILTPRLGQSGVVLTNGAGTNSLPIAEHVLALIFAFARQLPELARSQARHQWQRPPQKKFFVVQGQTLAVIGLGAIGQTLAAKAHLLGLKVLGVRRKPDGKIFTGVDRIYGIEALDEALAQAHHVAVCLPLTEATRGLFHEERFARFRDGAFFYNIGRGPIVDHPALERALASGKLAGAGLDVTVPEPLPPDSSLWANPHVIITNHSSGGSQGNAERGLNLLRDNIGRALRGEPLRNVVEKDRGY